MLAQAVYLHRWCVQKSSCTCRNATKCPWMRQSWCIHLIPVWPIHPPWPNLAPVLNEQRIGKCKWAASDISVWFSYSLSTSHGLTSTVSLIHVVIILSSGSSTVTSWGATMREQSGKCQLWANCFFFNPLKKNEKSGVISVPWLICSVSPLPVVSCPSECLIWCVITSYFCHIVWTPSCYNWSHLPPGVSLCS